MKEHPILFKPDMIKAIRAGRKTQTRRVPVERYRNWQVGDTIWVREAYGEESVKILGKVKVLYDSDYGDIEREKLKERGYKKKPSIHMPRWASRITLEITGLREEYVQDISEEDAKAEGIISTAEKLHLSHTQSIVHTYRWAFMILWDSINKKRGYGWDANPIVKVIEFKVIEIDSNFGHYFWPY